MIQSFKHKGLQLFFETGSKKGIQAKHAAKLSLQLHALNHASSPQDVNVPAWRLHALTGNLAGHWSMTVNGNWRITFRFTDDGNVVLLDYQDYH